MRYISIEYMNGHQFDLIYFDDTMTVRQYRLESSTYEEVEQEVKALLGLPHNSNLDELWEKNQRI